MPMTRLTTEQKVAIVRQSDRQPEWKQNQLGQWAADTFHLDFVPSQPTVSAILRQAGKPSKAPGRKKKTLVPVKSKVVKCPQVEKAMLQWLRLQIEKDEAVTVTAVQTTAQELVHRKKIAVEGFVVSDVWVDSFMRHHVLNLTPFGRSDTDSEENVDVPRVTKTGKKGRTDAGKTGKTSRRVEKALMRRKDARTPVAAHATCTSAGKRKRGGKEKESDRQVKPRRAMIGKDEAKRASFYVVYVPVDASKELEEWPVKLPQEKEAQLGCLTDRLREHFKGGSTAVSKQQQEETFKQQLLAQLPKGATLHNDMLHMMLQMESLVDSIPLVLNTRDVKHVGINMYVDDKGTAKALATNVRASAIAQACGKMLEVKGDAFIGRLFDNDDDFVRLDFRLSEVSADASWVQTAKLQAAAVAAGNGGAAMGAELARAKAPNKMMLPGSIQRICGADRCSKNGTLRCSRCKAQFYCSPECQKADWKLHKVGCIK